MINKRILFTGGHLTPAVAVMEKIGSDFDLIFVGRREAIAGTVEGSEEEIAVSKLGAEFIASAAGRWPREINLAGLSKLGQVAWGLITAFGICIKSRPDVVVSFGGYIGWPITIAAEILRIPVLIQEQTHGAGMANKLSAMFARRICVSYIESGKFFPMGKTIVSGLPLRNEIFSRVLKRPDFLGKELELMPILYITGGVTGARSLNKLIYEMVPELVKRFVVVHQVGRLNLENVPGELYKSEVTMGRYLSIGYLETKEHAYMLQKAIMVVSRSGANSVGEIGACGKVALLVPLPWSSGDEQRINAQYLSKMGSVVVVDQEKTTSREFLNKIEMVYKNLSEFKKTASKVKQKWLSDGASVVASEIIKLL